MALNINTNVASLNAQRSLMKSSDALAGSLQRLSSGLRINTAKDDAAGLAIATRFTAQIRGREQASRNANDAISLSQVAEGALDQMTTMLQRVRELAVQSATGSNSGSDRAAIDAEVQQLKSEITRVAEVTSFNGIEILNGNFAGGKDFHIGSQKNDGNQVINFSIQNMRTEALSSFEVTVGGAAIANYSEDTNYNVTVDGQTTSLGASNENAAELAGKLKELGVTASAKTEAVLEVTNFTNLDGALQIDGVAITGAESTTDHEGLAIAINSALAAASGAQATNTRAVLADDKGSLTLVNATNDNIVLAATAGGAWGTFDNTAANTDGIGTAANAQHYFGEVSVTAGSSFTFSGHTSATDMNRAAGDVTERVLANQDVLTQENANNTVGVVDSAIATINDARANLGAVQNRFQATVSGLATTLENLNASRGRITDADFAAESAKLTRNQILQQAGTAMLAQANSLPQAALSLLQ